MKKILLIDDSNTFKLNLEKILESKNVLDKVTILYENNGLDGIASVSKNNPDLVLLDWHMKGLNGLYVLSLLRQNKQNQNLPILMLSSDTNIIERSQTLLYGANEFLSKGLTLNDYFSTINHYLNII